jgi:hypothetical protein
MSVICSTGTRPAVSLTNSADREKINAAQSMQQGPELQSSLQKRQHMQQHELSRQNDVRVCQESLLSAGTW